MKLLISGIEMNSVLTISIYPTVIGYLKMIQLLIKIKQFTFESFMDHKKVIGIYLIKNILHTLLMSVALPAKVIPRVVECHQ